MFVLTKRKRVFFRGQKFFNIDIDNQAFKKLAKILRLRRQTLISGSTKWMILGKPLFEMCWFFMSIAPPSPPGSLTVNTHMEATHFKKGHPLPGQLDDLCH